MLRTISRLFLLVTLVRLQPAAVISKGSNFELRGLVASGKLSDLRWPDFSDFREQVQEFYEPTNYDFAWIAAGEATKQAEFVIGAIRDAAAKGLDPEDYDASRWDRRLRTLRQNRKADLVRFDLALTVSAMRYISDLRIGRANPGLFLDRFDLNGGREGLAHFMRRKLVNAVNVEAVLEGVEPPYVGYVRTEKALQKYLGITREDKISRLPGITKTIEPGSSYSGTTELANLLQYLGDLPPTAMLPESDVYKGSLVAAVQHFQMRHGLVPDGRIGKLTFAQLSMPLSYRVRQLQLSLERWRWMPRSFTYPPIVINIPEFRLRAFNSAYKPELEMKVVVGQAFRHETPMLAAEMKYLVFRPFWDVPRSIVFAELLPEVERDRSYFAKHGYELVTAQGKVVSDSIVDDQILAQLGSGMLRVRQVPGAQNALGLVKFIFPNKENVYLHGTPATELFARSRRDFSHGCIRVEKPEQLAAWVLRDQPEWTRQRIHEAMNGSRTVRVALNYSIPVVIVYGTAIVQENGEVHFFEDLYGQDASLEQKIATGCPRRYRKRAALF